MQAHMQTTMQTAAQITAADDIPDERANNLPDAALGYSAADKTLSYYGAPTFADYLMIVPQRRALLEARGREIRIAPDDQRFFVAYPDCIHWLAVVADDSPATAVVLPVLAHVAALSSRLDLRILDEEQAALALARLTGDPDTAALLADSDLPLLLSFDEEWQLQEPWGPHPAAIEPYLEQWLAAHPEADAGEEPADELLAQLAQEMRLWYNSGLNQACAAELRALLAGMQSIGDETAS